MPLMLCPECRTQVSNMAAACPHCGYPLPAPPAANAPAPVPRTFLSPRFTLAGTVMIFLTGFMIIGIGGGQEEAVAAACLMWAFLLPPLWWKSRRKAREAAAAIPPGVIEKVVEDRLRERLADLDDQARQLMELEERMEFTERLLTKVRDQNAG